MGDIGTDEQILDNCREAVKLNLLEQTVDVIGLSWGSCNPDFLKVNGNLDFIIGSDLFYDPSIFNSLCSTISQLLVFNPLAKVYVAVQIRSEDWSLEEHFRRWSLRGNVIFPKDFLRGTGIEEDDLAGKHSIFILEICRQ